MPRELTAEEIREQKRIAKEAIDDLASALGADLMPFDDLIETQSKLNLATKGRNDVD